MIKGHNLDPLYETAVDKALEFFSKAGALFKKSRPHYNGESGALNLFKPVWNLSDDDKLSSRLSVQDVEDLKIEATQLLFWLRDIRHGGAGNRSGFRECVKWLAGEDPAWVTANTTRIPVYGRWDDLTALYDTRAEGEALALWTRAIRDEKHSGHGLACKWAKIDDRKLQKALKTNERGLRKLLVAGRKVVEQDMCARRWGDISYESVPSLALSRYSKAFGRHDRSRFDSYKNLVESGCVKINSSSLFPHDCVRTALNGDARVADAQFAALPDYVLDKGERMLAVVDTGASMDVKVAGGITCAAIALGLGLYLSDRLDLKNAFWRKVLLFSDRFKMVDWSKMQFSDVVMSIPNGFCDSMNIKAVLQGLLEFSTIFQVPPEQMITTLVIISDRQFDVSVRQSEKPAVEIAAAEWKSAGYAVPRVVYWNLASYAGSPAEMNAPDCVLLNGFSPGVLRLVLGGFNRKTMKDVISRYTVNVPV